MNNIQLNEELYKKITPREMQIIREIKEGLSSKEIGVKLGVSLSTVEVHRHRILKKLGFRSSIEMVVAMIAGGLL